MNKWRQVETFAGKRYNLHYRTNSRREADQMATQYRADGFSTRIRNAGHRGRVEWHVYCRRKT